MTRVLIAPDKFKGSLTATEVAGALERGLRRGLPEPDAPGIHCLPVADGGDGTLDAALAAGYERVAARATGPTRELIDTSWARHGDTAIIEMADISGLGRLPDGKLAPLAATSLGTGEVMAQALEAGVVRIVLGIGGSACTDGGAGMLQALGARLLDRHGDEIEPGGAALAVLERVDLQGVDPRLREAEVVVACDVDNPLTGPTGAAAVYGPQKGADVHEVEILDTGLTRFADLVAAETRSDLRNAAGAGAAGGVGFAALAVLDARLRPGIELILELLDFESHLAGIDLVVVGEGALDRQSLHGKAPIGVTRLARAAGATVVAVCGINLLDADELSAAGIQAAYALSDLEPDPEISMRDAARLLEKLAADELVRHL